MALRTALTLLARRAGPAASQQQLLPAALRAAATPAAAAASAAPSAAALRLAAAAFSSSGSALSDSLQSLLQRELKHEETTYEKPGPLASGPPAPFTLASAPGDGSITLKRDYEGEEISIDASVNMQARGGGELRLPRAGRGRGHGHGRRWFVGLGGRGRAGPAFDELADTHNTPLLSQKPKGPAPPPLLNPGPAFDELADPLRDAFGAYLEARGVGEELGEWLRHALYDKEQTEYIRWLRAVGEFVGK
ncbi:hypothetical protein Rsub_13174 [Raphidocelis subcapitata]|uniref:Mitochondrial glycoprotein n=1 Tax=Raphidocelis subcapitata TaxID=307507 RepID=A0A2V0PKT4_9CHLO|nr:hypothetical protein Rsub_13174 [Raphidocelis subcapitata]|eukprot:GBG00412.1 hypothetical protein Rsub_13174 [Raphidocelis subcapitata]